MIKVALIIPYRNDRELFLYNLNRMIERQTLRPDYIQIVSDDPINDDFDITLRYRLGYDRLRNKGYDIISLMEVDDYYAPDYLETMVKYWEEKGRPDLLGLNHTIYYNIKIRAYFTMHHTMRSSAMNTLIKPDLDFKWCADNEPYTDIHLWQTLKGEIVKPEKLICVGIKHGVGKLGGKMHIDKLARYEHLDLYSEWLKENLDEESFKFYSTYFSDQA